MGAITDKSTKESVLKPLRIGHGTLECADIRKTRRFYEEVLGLECLQTSLRGMMIRLGTDQVYAVVETGRADAEMNRLNHNGLDVGSPEEVDEAYEALLKVQDEYGIKKILRPASIHGDHCFYFCDLDGNWWEIVHVRKGGYAEDFADEDRDITGLHELEAEKSGHTHKPEFRERIRAALQKRDAT